MTPRFVFKKKKKGEKNLVRKDNAEFRFQKIDRGWKQRRFPVNTDNGLGAEKPGFSGGMELRGHPSR